MKRCYITCALLVAALAAAVSAQAIVVTVTPESMGGWAIETSLGGAASIANYGYAVAQRPAYINGSPKPGPWIADDGTNLGQGAYYASLIHTGTSTAWLGLDVFNGQSLAGVPLSRIKTLFYYCLNAHLPTISIAGDWSSYTWWQYCRQPIQLQITAQSPDGSDRKQFWFLPFEPAGFDPGGDGSFLRGDKCGVNTNKWMGLNCINTANSTPPGLPSVAGYWYCPDPEMAFQSWDNPGLLPNVISQFGDYVLVPTSNDPYPAGWKSAGWDDTTDPVGTPLCNGTGKCINFEIGARKGGAMHIYMQDGLTWTNDFNQFRGYVDRFTMGIDSNGDGDDLDAGEKFTYDFEPSPGTPAPKTVCMTIKSSYDAVAAGVNNPQPGKTMVRFCGQVANRGVPRFWMDDPFGFGGVPTGVPQVACYTFEGDPMKATKNPWPNPTYIGDIFSVTGILERPRIEPVEDIPCSWSSWGKLLFLY